MTSSVFTRVVPSDSSLEGSIRASEKLLGLRPGVLNSSKLSRGLEPGSPSLPPEVLASLAAGHVRLLHLPNGGVGVVDVKSPSLFHE